MTDTPPARERDHYILRWFRLQIMRGVRYFAQHTGSPHAIALGVAIGVFIAFTPTVGVQMIIAATIAHLVGANRLCAALPAWITNPFTIVQIFLFNYWVGNFFVSGPNVAEVRALLHEISNLSFWEKVRAMLDLGEGALAPLWIGSVLVGAACAVPSYFIVRRFVVFWRERKKQRHEDRQNRVDRVLDDRAAANGAAVEAARTTSTSASETDSATSSVPTDSVSGRETGKTDPENDGSSAPDTNGAPGAADDRPDEVTARD